MGTEEPSRFEAAVLGWMASSSDDVALRAQLAAARIAERDYTVVGCYSMLVLPDDAPGILRDYGSRGPVNGPYFESPVVPHGGGTLLWFKKGRADCLEIYVHLEYFPEDHEDLCPFKLFAGP